MHIDLTNGVVELRDKEKGVLGMLADTLAWFKELIGFSKHEEEDTIGALGKEQKILFTRVTFSLRSCKTA